MGVKDPATERVVSEVWRAQEREAAPVEGAEAAMTRMIEAGYQIAVVSNIWPPFLTAVRAHFGTLIDAAVPPERQIYSFREGTAKPSAALFRQALQAGKADPRRAVMIGDSYREDIEPASLLGIWTIWLLHRPAKEAANVAAILNGTAPPPSRTLLSIAEIEPDLVEALLGGNPSQPTLQPRRRERSQAEGTTNANPGCGAV
jgi:HAD superfamily hydrolase (TIGR01509 family)